MRKLLFVACFLVGLGQAWAQQGYTIREVEVKKEPFNDAATLAKLPENTQLTITKRQGAWMEVTSAKANGWIRMLSVRLGEPGGAGSASGGGGGGSIFASLFNLGRGGGSGAAVTTGVRGLDKEQIKNAAPNLAELQRMQSYGATKADAQRFGAGTPRLAGQQVNYLTPPSVAASSPAVGAGPRPTPGSSPFGDN